MSKLINILNAVKFLSKKEETREYSILEGDDGEGVLREVNNLLRRDKQLFPLDNIYIAELYQLKFIKNRKNTYRIRYIRKILIIKTCEYYNGYPTNIAKDVTEKLESHTSIKLDKRKCQTGEYFVENLTPVVLDNPFGEKKFATRQDLEQLENELNRLDCQANKPYVV
ncbi:MAG: hypothetical protein IJX26_01880 [Clostridia bacterium]|nr:hypothetical protein [Clostridia bacterium]